MAVLEVVVLVAVDDVLPDDTVVVGIIDVEDVDFAVVDEEAEVFGDVVGVTVVPVDVAGGETPVASP